MFSGEGEDDLGSATELRRSEEAKDSIYKNPALEVRFFSALPGHFIAALGPPFQKPQRCRKDSGPMDLGESPAAAGEEEASLALGSFRQQCFATLCA